MTARFPVRFFAVALLTGALTVPVWGLDADTTPAPEYVPTEPLPVLNVPDARPRMSPELTLAEYESHARWQSQQLGETNDTTTITADLPDAAKQGRYRLTRVFSAPKSVAFKAIDFVGDGFVKTNVIARLLQSEVDHVQKDQPRDTAINRQNYKFSYKGIDQVGDRTVHVFQVKPRHKRAGLFKGKVFLDIHTGSMVRAEGQVVKSPSLFIKKIEFVQDYTHIGDFDLISHIHSVANTRIIGKAVVDISHQDYHVRSVEQLQAAAQANRSLQLVSLQDTSRSR
jgi:hypothetical protein